MLISRILVWAGAGVMLFFGSGYLIAPTYFAALVSISLTAPNALADFRAYGGLFIGIFIYAVYCAINDDRLYNGLILISLSAAGFFFGRLAGVVFSGSPSGVTIFYLVIEGVFTVVAVLTTLIKRKSINHK